MKWRQSTWGEEVSLEYGKALRGYDQSTAPVRVYGSNGPIGYTNAALHSGPGVILGRKGAYRGVEYSKSPFFVIDTAYYIVPKSSLDMRWLYYAVKHYKLGEIDDGSPVPSTTRSAVYVQHIEVPPIEEQIRIAAILGALDDKIELNQKTNATLEAMAKALFKSWFIDFDPVRAKMEGKPPFGMDEATAELFPDQLAASELGDIPEGWSCKFVENIAEKIAMGPFGSNIKVETFKSEGVPIISGQHLKGLLLEDNNFCFIHKEHAEKLSNSIVKQGDIVFTHAGNIGQVSIIPVTSRFGKYVISQRQFYLRCDVELVDPNFMVYYFHSKEGQHNLLANATSTGVPSISRPSSNLKNIKFIYPGKELTSAFGKMVDSFHCKIGLNKIQNSKIKGIRDYLLPKLISGELRIADAERMMEAI